MRLMQGDGHRAGGVGVRIVTGWVGSADAQVQGLPVYNSGVASGIAFYGDVGFANTNGVGRELRSG